MVFGAGVVGDEEGSKKLYVDRWSSTPVRSLVAPLLGQSEWIG